MDYFVQDGELVSTKKGMQVTKSKHKGIRFVNSVAPAPEPAKQKPKNKASSSSSSSPSSSSSSSSPSSSSTASASSAAAGAFSVFSISASTITAQHPLPKSLEDELIIANPDLVTLADRVAIKKKARAAKRTETSAITGTTTTETVTPTTTAKKGKKKTAADQRLQGFQGFSSFNVNMPHNLQKNSGYRNRNEPSEAAYQQVLECLLKARQLDNVNLTMRGGFSENYTGNLPAGHPTPSLYHAQAWRSLPVHVKASDNHKILFQLYLTSMPISMYPFEDILTHNPMRVPEFFESVAKDLGKLHTVVISSVLVEMHCRGMNPPQALTSLSFYLSRMCALVSEGLKEGDEAAMRARPYVLECIASMAIIGRFTGHYDDWHIHMNGLKKLVASHGGINAKTMDWYLIHKLRRADSLGAATTGYSPYLDYPRIWPDISLIMPPETRDELCLITKNMLAKAGVMPVVNNAVQNLILFHKAIMIARKAPPRTILFDPHEFVDEWFYVLYNLVRYPHSLREHCSFSQIQAAGGILTPNDMSPRPTPSPPVPPGMIAEPGPTHEMPSVPAATHMPIEPLDLISPVARLASCLFLHEFLIERPQAPNAHIVCLALLRGQIQAIVNHIKTHVLGSAIRYSSPGSTTGTFPTASFPEIPNMPPLHHVRPVLIWACIIGYIYTYRFPLVGYDPSFKPLPERAVFCECIFLLFPDQMELPNMADSEMTRLLDWTTISHSRLPADSDSFVALMRNEYLAALAEMSPMPEVISQPVPVRSVPPTVI